MRCFLAKRFRDVLFIWFFISCMFLTRCMACGNLDSSTGGWTRDLCSGRASLNPWTQSHRSSPGMFCVTSVTKTRARVSWCTFLPVAVPPVTRSLQSFCQKLAVLEFFPSLGEWHQDRGLPYVAHPLEGLSKTERVQGHVADPRYYFWAFRGDSSKPVTCRWGRVMHLINMLSN